jgi:hypothetical protein
VQTKTTLDPHQQQQCWLCANYAKLPITQRAVQKQQQRWLYAANNMSTDAIVAIAVAVPVAVAILIAIPIVVTVNISITFLIAIASTIAIAAFATAHTTTLANL